MKTWQSRYLIPSIRKILLLYQVSTILLLLANMLLLDSKCQIHENLNFEEGTKTQC